MGLHRVTKLVNAFNSGIGSSIETNAIISATNIVINGTGNADDIDTTLKAILSSICTFVEQGTCT